MKRTHLILAALLFWPACIAAPGQQTTSSQAWGEGACLEWEINDAKGQAGAAVGWDFIEINGLLEIDATSLDPFLIFPVTLTAGNAPGPMENFTESQPYRWTLVHATLGIAGWSRDKFQIDLSQFENATDAGLFTIDVANNDQDLILSYEPPAPAVPESTGTAGLLLLGLALVAGVCGRNPVEENKLSSVNFEKWSG